MTSSATWLQTLSYSSNQDQFNLSLVTRKPVFGGVRPSKTQTSLLSKRDQREAWNFGFSNYRYYTTKQRPTKLLFRLCGCTVWSQPLLFTYGINRFSHDVAHLIPNMVTFKKFYLKWHFRRWVQYWRSICYFSAFMICHFSIPSFTLQQNSDCFQVNIYLTRKHFRTTYTDSLNFFRAG